MKTGTCLRPSWTAIVCPTISGKTVEDRDQVRIMFFEPEAFIASMRLNSRSSTKGPFLDDLLIAYLFPLRRPRTIRRSESLCFSRVRLPSVGTPHGVTGWRPPFDLPSPPPCGWSTGFMAEPRTVGRLPRQRLRPAFPPVMFSWSTFPTWPIVARQVERDAAKLTGGEAQDAVALVLRDELDPRAGAAGHLPAPTGLELDVVHECARRDVLER